MGDQISMWIKCPECEQEIGIPKTRQHAVVHCPKCEFQLQVNPQPQESSWWPMSKIGSLTLLLFLGLAVIGVREGARYNQKLVRAEAERIAEQVAEEKVQELRVELDAIANSSANEPAPEDPADETAEADNGFTLLPGWHMGHTILLGVIVLVILAFILGAVIF